MIIDIHTHIYPDKAAQKAVVGIGTFYGVSIPERAGTADDLIAIGTQAGIDRFVMLPCAKNGLQVRKINDFTASVRDAHPKRIIPFGTLHPDMANPDDEIDRIIALGFRGIKIHPDFQHINIDDEGMFRLYSLLEGRLPVLFHTGDYRCDRSHPARLARVIDAFPRLTVVAAHFGGWGMAGMGWECLHDKRCYIDISSSYAMMGPTLMTELIRRFGVERTLFGSDYPMYDPIEAVHEVERLGLTDDERERVLYRNAQTLLGLSTTPAL
jgi:predicted TIM-barrel fold metal-dependent hydrolase